MALVSVGAFAVILDAEGRVLLCHRRDLDLWNLPGGRCEMMESGAVALAREMREEIGAEVRVERLLWAVESFFDYQENHYHEIGFYFLMTLPPASQLLALDRTFIGYEPTCTLIYRWHRLDALETVPLYPVFLRTGLRALPATPAHILDCDGLG